MNENIENIISDPVAWEAENVEDGFADIQDAMRLGLIVKFQKKSNYEPTKPALRTYTFVIYEEHLAKLQQAESNGLQGRTDPDV